MTPLPSNKAEAVAVNVKDNIMTLSLRAERPTLLKLPRELRDKIYDHALIDAPLFDKNHHRDCPLNDPHLKSIRPVYRSTPGAWADDVEEAKRPSYRRSHIGNLFYREGLPTVEAIAACQRLCIRRQGLNLRLLNTQVYDEIEEMFWKRNTFSWDSWDAFKQDLDGERYSGPSTWICQRPAMPASVRQKIQNIALVDLTDRYFEYGQLISLVTRLPNLVEASLPAHPLLFDIWEWQYTRVPPKLEIIRAVDIHWTLVREDNDVPLFLHFERVIHVTKDVRGQDPRQTVILKTLSDVKVWQFWWKVCEDVLYGWAPKWRYDSENPIIEKCVRAARGLLPKEDLPVQPADGSRHVLKFEFDGIAPEYVKVAGLPLLSNKAREKLNHKEMNRQAKEAAVARSREYANQQTKRPQRRVRADTTKIKTTATPSRSELALSRKMEKLGIDQKQKERGGWQSEHTRHKANLAKFEQKLEKKAAKEQLKYERRKAKRAESLAKSRRTEMMR